jgi:hypothetical protein
MMDIKKALPYVLIAGFAAGTGTLMAVAQDNTDETAVVETQDRAKHARADGDRGGRHANGHHGKRRGGMNRGMMREIFEKVDADNDGGVTRGEIDTFRAAQVGAADISGDGALSIEEFDTLYRDFMRTRMVRTFQRFDRDGDGSISADEIDRPIEHLIQRMDRDGDGTLKMQRGRDRRG